MTDAGGARRPGRFRRQVVVNTAATGLGNGWAIVVALVSLPLLLHGLGPTAFGTWVLIQTFSAVTGWFSLADLGTGVAATRAIAEQASLGNSRAVGRLVSSALATFVGLGAVCAAALAVAGPALLPHLFRTPHTLRHDLRVALVLFAVQVVIDLGTEGAEACLEGLQRVDLSRAVDAARRTVVAAATVVVAQVDHRLVPVVVASVVASTGGALVAAVVLRRHLPEAGRPSMSLARQLLRQGRAVALLRPLGVLQRTMDRLVVGAILGPAAVSLVEIATQIQSGAEAVLSASSYAVVPAAAWLSVRGDRGTLRELLDRGTKYSLLATVPVATISMFLSASLIRVWLGGQYVPAAGLAVVALIATLVAAPMSVGSNLLLGVGRAAEITRAAAIAIVVNGVLSVVLVHTVGIVGSFDATVVSCLVLVPLLARPVLHETGSNARTFVRAAIAPVLAPTVGLAVAAGLVVALPLSAWPTLVVGGFAGLAAYAVVAWRFVVHRTELDELRAAISRES